MARRDRTLEIAQWTCWVSGEAELPRASEIDWDDDQVWGAAATLFAKPPPPPPPRPRRPAGDTTHGIAQWTRWISGEAESPRASEIDWDDDQVWGAAATLFAKPPPPPRRRPADDTRHDDADAGTPSTD